MEYPSYVFPPNKKNVAATQTTDIKNFHEHNALFKSENIYLSNFFLPHLL